MLGSLPHSNSFRSQIPASRGAVPEMLAMCEALIAARLQAVFHRQPQQVSLDRTGAGSRGSCDQLFWSLAFKILILLHTRDDEQGTGYNFTHPRHKIYESTEQVFSHDPSESKYQFGGRKAVWLLLVLHPRSLSSLRPTRARW